MIDEKEIRRAVNLERLGWEHAIFHYARRAGLETSEKSAGQLLADMSDKILENEKKLANHLLNAIQEYKKKDG